MAKTLLDGVNEVLRYNAIIRGDQQAFTSLTSSAHQHSLDLAVQKWREAVAELYSLCGIAYPLGTATGIITFVFPSTSNPELGEREYDLAANMEQFQWNLRDRLERGYRIFEYHGGYERMMRDQLNPSAYRGMPQWAAINPVTGKLRMDRHPTEEFNGNVFEYDYRRRIPMVAFDDAMPFSDTVFEAMVPLVGELWALKKRGEYSDVAAVNFGRAGELLTRQVPRAKW